MTRAVAATPRRRAGLAWGIAGLIMVVAGGVIALGGVDPLPRYPSLDDSPDERLAGTVAYISRYPGTECLSAIPAAGGQPEQLLCDDDLRAGLGWTPDGRIVVSTGRRGDKSALVLDPASAEVVQRFPLSELAPEDRKALSLGALPSERKVRADGTRVRIRGDRPAGPAVQLQFSDGSKQTILTVDSYNARYWFNDAQWSPDGQWVLVSDSASRLLIVAPDGDESTRELVKGDGELTDVSWYQSGTPQTTITLPN